jgi:serine/threonine protein phosphatase 1
MTDIHGRLEPLKALLAQIPEGAKMVFLGDYVDRGSQSREVVALVRSLPNAVCLRGNHEDMVCAPDPRNWLANGGAATPWEFDLPSVVLTTQIRLTIYVGRQVNVEPLTQHVPAFC